MHNFLAMPTRASGVATVIAVATLVVALGGAVVISGLHTRIEKIIRGSSPSRRSATTE
jgi:hypothetical protein